MNTLYLIRHGENLANITKEFSHRLVDYSLTPKGRKQLAVQTTKWEKLARAIAGILRPAGGEGKS